MNESGRNGFNIIFDQIGNDIVTVWNVPLAVPHVVADVTVTLAVVIAPLKVQLFASETA